MVDSFDCFLGKARHSLRMNKGNGGQIVQLQNIEYVQIQTTARVMCMDPTTVNEPVNPMKPSADEQSPMIDGRQRLHLKGSSVGVEVS